MECGESDDRNDEFNKKYTPEKFYKVVLNETAPLILDVGAHTGESVEFFNSIFPNADIYSVEPDPASYSELIKCYPDATKALNVAVGAKTGVATFFQYDKSHLNSLYAINKDSKDSLGYAEKSIATKIDVECVTLNDLVINLGIELKTINLLKIDAQGGEFDILCGAQSMLKNVENITIELSFYDFYKKRNSFQDIEKMLPGFELYAITKLSQNPKSFRTDWAEVFYTRERSSND